MATHTTTVNIRFCETDALGHVSNTSYFIYLEEARIRMFEELGYGSDIKEWRFILASTKCDFINQAFFGQRLKIETNVSKIGNKSFQLVHRILDEKTGTLIALGESTVVYFNFETQKSEPIPDDLRKQLEQYTIPESKQAAKKE
ncbi:acyl-CoA thioesterase [Parageobacillus toebii NBRC 107807]|jgi:acyl-CoA thioester hydrolase|uniref:Acyl-CoA thioester hydrolase n=2 Tax=Parageobacillus TaxID=1906945 RepID=A0A6G9J5U9_9BACL|nr:MULTISPECIES: thioesterase family protein [Bacillaceae]MBB3869868.1 acyl-CoA thioester hydrolase [Parageobacillus toebii NBRC 107807]MED4968288.1 thioesterase family protein [Parageobacillus toebii]MED4990027.1 thioesterase family protein [Parageobacillus toebii]OXB91757.1 thioesterase [Parageobacillus galactosidasius]QIQ33542.1 acyl-CoA thioesterase [Parageobacillus toebii NBRC 107807]